MRLTVDHLHDAVIALDIRQQVTHPNVVPLRSLRRKILECLARPALRVDVIAPGEVGVDRAGVTVVGSSRQRVFVEALLGDHAVRVFHVGSVADEELDVPLRRRASY